MCFSSMVPLLLSRVLGAQREPVVRGAAGRGPVAVLAVLLGKRGVVLGMVGGASEAVDWPL